MRLSTSTNARDYDKGKIKAISSDTHQLYATPLHHNIIIIVDTIVRLKPHFKHEK